MSRIEDYLIIDCHTHFFPPQVFPKIVQAMNETPAKGYFGSLEDFLYFMEQDGVSKSIILTFIPTAQMKDAALRQLPAGLPDYEKATKEIDQANIERIKRNNQWACDVVKGHPNLIPFISVDPIMSPQQIREEILDKVNKGAGGGLKLNPGMCRYFPFDRRLWSAYEVAQEIDLPVMAQSFSLNGATEFSEPKYYGDVLSHFPRLRLILTHAGMPFWDQVRVVARNYPNVCFDMSLNLDPEHKDCLSDREFIDLFREVGMGRVVYGSSFPWHPRAPVLERILNMDLTSEEKRQILGENALRIYKLTR